jgi:hypothetical protein
MASSNAHPIYVQDAVPNQPRGFSGLIVEFRFRVVLWEWLIDASVVQRVECGHSQEGTDEQPCTELISTQHRPRTLNEKLLP